MSKIPLCIPHIDDNEKDAMLRVLESGWLTHGPYNKEFERLFADHVGVEHAVTMNSCTSALESALVASGITGEVIVPSFTFVASANSIVTAGATPVFCDVDLDTRNVTAEHLEKLLTPKTEAVMVVHYAGQCCPMDDIMSLCADRGLLLIEDSAETIGGTWKGRQAGSFGLGCFSFFPTKNITTGEGGMLTCGSRETYERVKTLIAHGIPTQTMERKLSNEPWSRSAVMAGKNYRMSNLLAVIGCHQMAKLDDMNERRRQVAARYTDGIRTAGLTVEPPLELDDARHVYQMYTVRVAAERRNDFIFGLKERGVEASVHFTPPVHLQTFYRENHPARTPLPNSELLSTSLVTLPVFPDMTDTQVDTVLQAMEDTLR